MVRILHDAATVRLHTIRIGDALLLASPAEVTADLSLNIKSRVDQTAGNVYQGYQWPQAPEWVKARVRNNFSTDEIEPESGAPIPIVISHANGYMGYIVSARVHYRQEMTAFGAGTADHVASSFVAMVRQLEGGAPFQVDLPSWRDVDLMGVAAIQQYLSQLDQQVVEFSRNLPPSDPEQVGTILLAPAEQNRLADPILFSWRGGTNDMDPPAIAIERQDGSSWIPVASGPSRDMVLLFDAPDQWTAHWRNDADLSGGPFRFRVAGTYRGVQALASAPDPIWDPDGKNAEYQVLSSSFALTP
jgi:hypothetical protein